MNDDSIPRREDIAWLFASFGRMARPLSSFDATHVLACAGNMPDEPWEPAPEWIETAFQRAARIAHPDMAVVLCEARDVLLGPTV